MPFPGAMAHLAIDAWLGPGSTVAVASEIVIRFELADVAAITRSVKRLFGIGPVKRRFAALAMLADATGGCVEPFLPLHVVSYREDLETSAFHWGEKVEDILPTEDMEYRQFPASLRTEFYDPGVAYPVLRIADANGFRLRRQLRPGELRCKRLHGQTMVRGGPLLVKALVAASAL